MIEIITYGITGAVLAAASYTDLRTREVPDWLNYSAAALGIAAAAVYSVLSHSIWPLLYSAAGLLIFFGIGCIMFYAGQWGGGDSKLLIALGSLLGLQFGLAFPFIRLEQPLVSFWINLLFVGVAYAMLWSIIIAVRNRQRFAKQFLAQAAELKMLRTTIILLPLATIIVFLAVRDYALRTAAIGTGLILLFGFYIWMFAKAVEKSSMLKYVEPEKLTEGDWIARDVLVGKRRICGPKDLGIEKRQIAELIRLRQQGRVKKVLVKEGIPFVPAFLLAFLVTVKFGSVMQALVSAL
ncbi:prepilin peptidase [Candidatus Woesearchaeota archaeon]|nr:prepilin peptidase [Candidatus Woesearchaeota archaeon]